MKTPYLLRLASAASAATDEQLPELPDLHLLLTVSVDRMIGSAAMLRLRVRADPRVAEKPDKNGSRNNRQRPAHPPYIPTPAEIRRAVHRVQDLQRRLDTALQSAKP